MTPLTHLLSFLTSPFETPSFNPLPQHQDPNSQQPKYKPSTCSCQFKALLRALASTFTLTPSTIHILNLIISSKTSLPSPLSRPVKPLTAKYTFAAIPMAALIHEQHSLLASGHLHEQFFLISPPFEAELGKFRARKTFSFLSNFRRAHLLKPWRKQFW